MFKNVNGGEAQCRCTRTHRKPRFVVITGGPGAGKTALLEYVRKLFCQHVAILPEAAGILFHGGFWRMETPAGKMAAQRAIYHVQTELQNIVWDEKKWTLALCDRGTLDGLAYWPKNESQFLRQLRTTKKKEYAKYLAVIHLESPSAQMGYNKINPLRIESPEQAKKIDARIRKAWEHHPNYFFIESKLNFTEKVNIASHIAASFVPKCCIK